MNDTAAAANLTAAVTVTKADTVANQVPTQEPCGSPDGTSLLHLHPNVRTLARADDATRLQAITSRRWITHHLDPLDETAVTAAIEEQRRLLAGAQATSKAARRALARLPATVPLPADSATTARSAPGTADDEDDGRVPPVVEGEAWRTEFLT